MQRIAIRACVVALAVALTGGPFAGLIGKVCTHCPPQCPMHLKSTRHCHDAVGTHAHQGQCGRLAGISIPGCSHGNPQPTAMLARGTLPQPIVVAYVSVSTEFAQPLIPAHTRVAEPPDPPPPIVIA
ncbi:MAG TPA: hypothetical protein VMW17_14855 [Candidatus Binatia bacterium]|nr:hypothetical protein [Candidatus Binatia bacterium]